MNHISKEEIDEIIKESLTQEEAKFYDALEEQNLLQKVGGLFHGKMKWINVMMNIVMVIIFIGTVYCTIEFFKVDSTFDIVKWGLGIFIGMSAISFMKLIGWMQMNKNDLLRELKRLELQIATMTNKSSKGE